MNVSIPIFITTRQRDGQKEYLARPLFFIMKERSDFQLSRLLTAVSVELNLQLGKLASQENHHELSMALFSPQLTEQRLEVVVELRRRTVKVRHLFASFHKWDRRIVFSPTLPECWFEVMPNQELAARAGEVFSAHYRALESDDKEVTPSTDSVSTSAWIEWMSLSLSIPRKYKPPKPAQFFSLFAEEKMNGANELERVGRCLDRLYPEDLDRPRLRDSLVEELDMLLKAPEKRPLLLMGPSKVGKTAVIHEVIRRRVERRTKRDEHRGHTWLIAPQRLIAGMSYVGQWEDRLLSILRHMSRRDSIFFVDDLIGLQLAGVSASSSSNVAAVLKPYLERREIRLLGEITPGEWRLLRERDRGLSDLFHVVQINEPNDREALRMIYSAAHDLEQRTQTIYHPDTVPAVMRLTGRYDRASAFPGKALPLLRGLADRNTSSGDRISPSHALELFAERAGIATGFLDDDQEISRRSLVEELAGKIIDQEAAVEAVADLLLLVKARLTDPERPLGSLLFLGPTGVGKTETAKALASVLSGNIKITEEQLVRFDMNEYVEPGSAARLIGTPWQPDGLLTEAVRRRPFAVILFDEIEKADGEVFDLLLQVLGEARLSDARGRTVDFSNCAIVMTSNLGVREAEGQIGFGGARPEVAAGIYRQAAERFFRPEFFNRIDKIVPFRRLPLEGVRRIADRILKEILAREGLLQRRCILQVGPTLLDQVVTLGYDEVYGARSMKRAVEQAIVRPLAAQLAAVIPGDYTIVSLMESTDREPTVHVQALTPVPVLPEITTPESIGLTTIRGYRTQLEDLEKLYEHLRPTGGITRASLAGGQVARYYELHEKCRALKETLSEWETTIVEDRLLNMGGVSAMYLSEQPSRRMSLKARWNTTVPHSQIRDHADNPTLERILEEWVGINPSDSTGNQAVFEGELALFEAMIAAIDEPPLLLDVWTNDPEAVIANCCVVLPLPVPDKTTPGPQPHATVEATSLEDIVQSTHLVGTHLAILEWGTFFIVQAAIRNVGESFNPASNFGPVVRIYDCNKGVLDLRVGQRLVGSKYWHGATRHETAQKLRQAFLEALRRDWGREDPSDVEILGG